MSWNFCIFAPVKHQLKYKPMSTQKVDPDVVKLIIKIAVYALTAIASFIGGNAVAQTLGFRLFS